MDRLIPATLLALSFWIAFSTSKTLCPRIFFQNINEKTMPYKIIEGVYIKEINSHNNFPVYRRENDNLLFYYTRTKGGYNYLLFGLNLGDSDFGVSAALYDSVDPATWLSSGIVDRSDVFGGLIRRWQYFNSREQTNLYVSTSSSSPMIKAVCVDEDFRECNSDRLYLNQNFTDGKGNVLNDLAKDYFSREIGVFRNLRPVYEHSKKQMYLQYLDGYWVVTGAYRPSNYLDKTYMRVKDFALRPEYISKTWSVHFNGWRESPKLRVLCRGVTSMSNTCSSRPCNSNARCVYTSGNETLCVCASGYTGVTCSTNKQCPVPAPFASTELNFAYSGRRPGDLGMLFCKNSYPDLRFSLCVDSWLSAYWNRQGKACRGAATTTPPRSTPATQGLWGPRTTATTPINFDDIPYIMPVVLTGATVLQFLLPFVIFYCAKCVTGCKESKEERDDQRRLQEVGGELGRTLEQVARAECQEELDRGIQEYQQAVQGFQDENDEKELSRKRGFYRNASLWRLISMHLYFSFYLWLIYFVGCEVSQCTRYGRIFNALRIYAIVMMSVSPVIVIIESSFCHEGAYLSNIMPDETAWGYIQKMHKVRPQITMIVECYHFETRVRVVYYKDANGQSQSRTETYTEKVVTYVDQDEFSFGSWVDVSKKEMPPLGTASLTRVRIDPCVLFGDEQTADDYASQVAAMLERNRHRDVYTDYSAKKEIPGLKKRISTYVDLNVRPWWIHVGYFWLATVLMMTWPYRWLFRAKTGKCYYILKKKMYKSTTPPREAVDLLESIASLASNAQSLMPSYAADKQVTYSTEMGAVNTPLQNGYPPDPPINADGTSWGPHPGIPPIEHGASALHSQVNAPLAAGPGQLPYPAPSIYSPYPYESALPPYSNGPSAPPYIDLGPLPENPPPSYDATVGYAPQPIKENVPHANDERRD